MLSLSRGQGPRGQFAWETTKESKPIGVRAMFLTFFRLARKISNSTSKLFSSLHLVSVHPSGVYFFILVQTPKYESAAGRLSFDFTIEE